MVEIRSRPRFVVGTPHLSLSGHVGLQWRAKGIHGAGTARRSLAGMIHGPRASRNVREEIVALRPRWSFEGVNFFGKHPTSCHALAKPVQPAKHLSMNVRAKQSHRHHKPSHEPAWQPQAASANTPGLPQHDSDCRLGNNPFQCLRSFRTRSTHRNIRFWLNVLTAASLLRGT